jgi:hypothetical protein
MVVGEAVAIQESLEMLTYPPTVAPSPILTFEVDRNP